jgi:deoxyribodipyrimidine photo-lyase
MAAPEAGALHCSRLSTHLAFGTLSIREVLQAGEAALRTSAGSLDPDARRRAGALRSFLGRLHWRCHFVQKLEDEPEIEQRPFHPFFADLRSLDSERLRAWAEGRTGWPYLDACMRALAATGWLNFRARAMLVAVSSYQLWQEWREPGLHLARLFTDYEPGIHWPQVQMQSGVTGINVPRIYNPIKQSRDQDRSGAFIRRWVPELAGAPDAWLHTPWLMPSDLQRAAGCVIGRDYPFPIVDHEQAAREARARLIAWRRRPGMSELNRAVLAKHGSRKRRVDERPAPSQSQGDLFDSMAPPSIDRPAGRRNRRAAVSTP